MGQGFHVLWIVDGMNVIGSRPDGWWRDRAGARRRLVGQLAALVGQRHEAVRVVFDGRGGPGEAEAAAALGVEAAFAPGGPNAADDVIAAMVAAMADPHGVSVVTSDGELARRVRSSGAQVLSVSAFGRMLAAPGE